MFDSERMNAIKKKKKLNRIKKAEVAISSENGGIHDKYLTYDAIMEIFKAYFQSKIRSYMLFKEFNRKNMILLYPKEEEEVK